jgi:hypothetical protein
MLGAHNDVPSANARRARDAGKPGRRASDAARACKAEK